MAFEHSDVHFNPRYNKTNLLTNAIANTNLTITSSSLALTHMKIRFIFVNSEVKTRFKK